MELTEEQIEFIRKDIKEKGVQLDELADSILDHICCILETSSGASFEKGIP